MMTIKDFSFRYKESTRNSLEHISLQVNEGEALGVVGPSQAGKTTFAYAVAGLLQKHFHGGSQTGTLFVKDGGLLADPSSIGFVFQDVSLQLSGVTETVEEEIAFSLEQFGVTRNIIEERIEEQLTLFRFEALRRRHPKTLSGGETQILAIACEAAKHPQLFILDEPTQSLDAQHTQRLIDDLRILKRSTTIIFIEHQIAAAFQLCDHVLFLEDGRQRFFGAPQDLLVSNTDCSSLVLPEWVEAQQMLGRRNISLSYRETVQWLKRSRTYK
jgi:energy-coupling factor transport system ATP-binding protein